ncbi:MAG TPA: pyrroloquinoline quinone biosynthesis protein PqqB [Candidatus Solibacter sp.]|nr:pyrroloquinoline quinone biosynthesis protein PqqB [Candidatus Solibacter sp.]
MRVKVLGSAAGGGFPQWNCACSQCMGVRTGVISARPRTQAQAAVSSDGAHWFLLNASPDLRQQILSSADLAPASGTRNSPITAVLLTSADVDAVMGLLHLREFQPLKIFATVAVRRILTEENGIFRVLARSVPPVKWETLYLDRLIPLIPASPADKNSGLFCKAVPLSGSFPDYVSDALRDTLAGEEAVIGLSLVSREKRFFYAPNLPGIGDRWLHSIEESNLALLDGTFWKDDELNSIQKGSKSARAMGHLPLWGDRGLLRQPFRPSKTRKILVHINNTNPILNDGSAEARIVREAGWEIAYDGMELAV